MSPGERSSSVGAVPQTSTIFEGHFPDYPLMPGVLQIECMAQTVGGWSGAGQLHRHAVPGRRQGSEIPHAGASGRRSGIRRQGGARGLGLHDRRDQGNAARQAGVRRPASPIALLPFPNPGIPSPPCRKRAARLEVPVSRSSASERAARGLDHRRRSAHVPWRGDRERLESSRAGDAPPYDAKSFAPYIVHPLAPVNFDKQIPKKSDQRQMEPWQRDRRLCGGSCSHRRRHRRQTRSARPHRHDRCRRRRRTRHPGDTTS